MLTQLHMLNCSRLGNPCQHKVLVLFRFSVWAKIWNWFYMLVDVYF